MKYYIIPLILFFLCCQPKREAVKGTDDSTLYLRTDLYFGLSAPKDSVTTSWEAFADSFITPVFPNGYTVCNVEGRWRDSDSAKTAKEQSKVLTIIYKPDSAKNKRIEYIMAQYKQLFKQKAVLRTDCPVTTNLDNY